MQALFTVSVICFAVNDSSAEDVNLERKSIVVTGEIKQPKAISVNEETDLVRLLSLCGGFTDDANIKRVLVIQNGKLKTVDLTALNGIIVDGEYRVRGKMLLNSGSVVIVTARADEQKDSNE